MPISVGSVEVDIIPSTQGIYQRLRDGLVPPATRAGEDAGSAAGRAFAPAMAQNINNTAATAIGERIGQQIAARITAQIRTSVADGITQGGAAARPAAARQGDQTAGAFARTLRARLEAAFRALPQLQVGADTTEADADLQALRVRMETLADKRIGIDIDEAEARAEIAAIQAELARLGAEHPNVQVRADTATAQAELAAVLATMDAVDGRDAHARVDVDTSGALSAVFQLSVALGALAAIPAIPVLAAGAGSLVAAFTAAGVGVGAFAAAAIPAVTQIKGALDAQKQAQEAASTATAKGGQTAAQAASRALQLAGAQAALASAERNGARQIAQARQGVADAIAQAAQRQQQADRAVASAEKDLTQAQKDQRQAQLDLVAARKTAAEQLVDLNNQQKDGVLALRRAEQQNTAAQKQLAADKAAGSKVSADQLAADQLAADEAAQALVEQQIATKRLTDQTAAANKAGVKGSSTYTQAQDALAQAQQNVADKTQAVKDAQADQARTEQQNARSIADAQAKVAEAEASAADSIASAQRQVASASLSSASASNASATAADKYQQALAKLSPAARGTFNAFLALRTAFKAWSLALQPTIMPIFTRALNGLKNSLPGLTPIVLGAARGISTLQDRISNGFKSPWWQTLKKDFAGSVEPAILRVGRIVGNLFVGMAGIIDAFLPHLKGISNQSDGITRRFANFGKNLKTNPKFASFLQYANEQAPKLGEALGRIATAFLNVSKAIAPLSGPALAFITLLATGISAVATNAPGALQLIYGIYVATKLAKIAQVAYNGAMLAYRLGVVLVTLATEGWTAAQVAANGAMDANPAVIVIIAIIAAIALLVVGILYAWNHFAWFRDSVKAVWQAIQVAALFMWNSVLKPTFNALAQAALWLWQNALKPSFDAIVIAFRAVATAAIWLWQNILAPVFKAIGAIFAWWWTNIVDRYFKLVKFAFQTWAALVLFVYNKTIKPVFSLMGTLIAWWWNNIVHRYFELVMATLRAAGSVFSWLYSNAVKPAMSGVNTAVSWGWSHVIKPAFDALKTGIRAVGTAFSDTKGAIAKAWDGVKQATKDPINFVLNTVWNKGIVGVWQKIGGWIPGLPKLGKLPLLAQGGQLPVRPGVFNSPTAIVGEGNPRHPEYVIPTDPKYRSRALALLGEAGAQMLSGGGVIGSITGAARDVGGAISSAGSAAWSGVKTAGDFLKNPVGNLVKLLDPILNKVGGHFTDTAWGKMAAALPKTAVEGLKKLVGLGGSSHNAAYRPSSGVAQWAPTILQALALVGQPPSWLATVERRMNQESGGNPTIVNKWDSNWKAGHPSVGLMQVIAGTFQHYAGLYRSRGPFSYGVSVDPLANIYAGLNYAMHRYGSLSALNRPGGYDSGGYLQPGLNLAYNGTGRPEPVFTSAQANALLRLAAAPAGTGGGEFTGDLYLSGGEFLGKVRGVVREENGAILTALGARPRG